MNFEDKNVLVYGTGKSGIGSADLLCRIGARPILYDENVNSDVNEILGRVECPDKVRCLIGSLSEEDKSVIDAVVLSPGVPTEAPALKYFYDKGIPVTGEIELAYQASKGVVYAITGTNGKTTTTSILGAICSEYSDNTFVVGNIGTPYTSVATKTNEDSMIVAEVSSFQLETIIDFKAHVSAILNITEDHLNRHHTMEEYIRVKERVAEHQGTDDFCILNYEDEVLRQFGMSICDKTNVVYFSSARKIENGIWLDGKNIVMGYEDTGFIINTDDLLLIGIHNYENVMAAAAMAVCAGIPLDVIRTALKKFRSVEHRIEYVREVKGVVYYNDSKGTNPDAAIKGIQAMSRPTLLIGGGYDKGSDYRPWINSFGGKVKYFVLEGVTREEIKRQALECGFPEEKIIMRQTMTEALDFCADNASEGDAVLLSPACASWGEFDNYEQRGTKFKEYVNNL
ncbi:MAG: UDP-N-acetylmuramoyl-L-alanine--D-glutamate ligase [Lachnospiraceae bacterium]|jgi:UDP-N-acetylmuramoylalanine--D-glutamate ligase